MKYLQLFFSGTLYLTMKYHYCTKRCFTVAIASLLSLRLVWELGIWMLHLGKISRHEFSRRRQRGSGFFTLCALSRLRTHKSRIQGVSHVASVNRDLVSRVEYPDPQLLLTDQHSATANRLSKVEESLNGIRHTGIPVLRDRIDSNREPVYKIFENRRAGEAINFAGVIINLVSGVDRTIMYQRELWSNMQKG